MDDHMREKIAALLSRVDDLTLATLRPDGFPQATVVSYVSDGLDIYFGTGANAQKAHNLARDPRVSGALTAPYKDWNEIEGLSFAALAHRITAADDMAKVGKMMFAKFPQAAGVTPPDVAMALFRLEPRVFSVLDYRKGFGHTELVGV
jgi:general stress protein 26